MRIGQLDNSAFAMNTRHRFQMSCKYRKIRRQLYPRNLAVDIDPTDTMELEKPHKLNWSVEEKLCNCKLDIQNHKPAGRTNIDLEGKLEQQRDIGAKMKSHSI